MPFSNTLLYGINNDLIFLVGLINKKKVDDTPIQFGMKNLT